MKTVSLIFMLFFFGFILSGFVFGAEKNVDVAVKVVDKIEVGNTVQITNGEFKDEEALVVAIDKGRGEAELSLLNHTAYKLNLSFEDLKILNEERISETSLSSLKPLGNNFLFILSLILILLFVFIFIKNKKVKRRKRIKSKKKKTGLKIKRNKK